MTTQFIDLETINDQELQVATGGEKLPYWMALVPGLNMVMAPVLIGQAIQEVVEGPDAPGLVL
jgi:hypothetical protein